MDQTALPARRRESAPLNNAIGIIADHWRTFRTTIMMSRFVPTTSDQCPGLADASQAQQNQNKERNIHIINSTDKRDLGVKATLALQ
jgi:hypothetical protein